MYKQASRFRQSLVRRGDRDTGGRNLVMSDSVRATGPGKTAQMRRFDKEAKLKAEAPPRGGSRLVKRKDLRSPAEGKNK
jgi:hypothetical protein